LKFGEASLEWRRAEESPCGGRDVTLLKLVGEKYCIGIQMQEQSRLISYVQMLVFDREQRMRQYSETERVKTIGDYLKIKAGWSIKGVCWVGFPQSGIMDSARFSRTYLAIAKEGACYLDINPSGRVSDAQFFDWSDITRVSVQTRHGDRVLQFQYGESEFWFSCRKGSSTQDVSGNSHGLLTDSKSLCRSFRWRVFRAMLAQRKRTLHLRNRSLVGSSIYSPRIREASVA
jgi:hypothetical protein